MLFKDYTNPLYDTVEDERWVSGLCCIFARALEERFALPLKAVLVRSRDEPSATTLVHAFGSLPGGLVVDALGIRPEDSILATDYRDFTESDWRALHCARPGEEVEVIIAPVTFDELWDLNPEDLDATNAAHTFIEQHPERFGSISAF